MRFWTRLLEVAVVVTLGAIVFMVAVVAPVLASP
jgi:hypothetical protein